MCFVVIAYCALVGKSVISCAGMRIRVMVSFIVQRGLYSIEKAFEFDCFSWIPQICMKALTSPWIVTEVLDDILWYIIQNNLNQSRNVFFIFINYTSKKYEVHILAKLSLGTLEGYPHPPCESLLPHFQASRLCGVVCLLQFEVKIV